MNYIKEFEQNLAYYFSELLEKPLAKPLWIYISLSHRCTYNCQMCGVVKILKGYELSMEAIRKVFDEIAAWDWDFTVVITGGEVFLREDIFDVFKYGQKSRLSIEVVSNGALINQDISNKIMSSGLKNIAISLDGATEQTHDFIRENGAFRKAIEAIKYLVAAKKKNGFGPQISVWTTIMKENVSELFDIISLVKDLGVECLVYHPVIVAQEDMQNTSANARFWLNGNDIDILKKQIDKIVNYQKNNGLVAFLHDPYLWVKHFEGKLTKKDWKCNPFVFTNIGPDGEIRSCGAAFGNINKMSLKACLDTEEARKARNIMKSCTKSCLQTCWANPQADSLANIIDKLIHNIENDSIDKKTKKELLSAALSKITEYEELLRNA
ncbi:MAG: radical SAM protein [Candidatus Omnitrophica bacterium]|nr:radical SAM protein [Candidatus Omnitrophota bacterium]MBU1924083.1 radical SAM protein [Candidatus Omnitrophota bacterium]